MVGLGNCKLISFKLCIDFRLLWMESGESIFDMHCQGNLLEKQLHFQFELLWYKGRILLKEKQIFYWIPKAILFIGKNNRRYKQIIHIIHKQFHPHLTTL